MHTGGRALWWVLVWCVSVCAHMGLCVHVVVHACAIVGSTHVYCCSCQGLCPCNACTLTCLAGATILPRPVPGSTPLHEQLPWLEPCQSQGQGIRPCQGQGLDVGPVNALVTVFILATACTNIHNPLATKCNDGQGLRPSQVSCSLWRPCGGGGAGLSATQ